MKNIRQAELRYFDEYERYTGNIDSLIAFIKEDAGKSIHDQDVDTLIDINRCGVPLLEIVTEPDINSPQEAALYLTNTRDIQETSTHSSHS